MPDLIEPDSMPDPMEHPDNAPPSKELKDIALKSAAAAGKAERQVTDLGTNVGVLTSEVIGLRTEVSKAVKQDELRRAQRRTLRTLLWPLIIATVVLLGIALGVAQLTGIARQNRINGDQIVSCTIAPRDTSPAQLRAHACFVRTTRSTSESIRHLECTNLLIHNIDVAACDDVKADLVRLGVHLPVENPPKAP